MSQFDYQSKKKSEAKKPRFNDTKFVNYELTEQERALCKSWCIQIDDLDKALLGATDGGYKLSMSWDERNQCYACFMYPVAESNTNWGMTNTGRGSTPLKAVRQVLYKHFVVFDQVWGAYAERTQASEYDD